MPDASTRAPASVADIDWSRYDFVDMGCSAGGSLQHCRERFGAGTGLGVDTDPDKVAWTVATGREALAADVLDLKGHKVVRFVSMMQFLEHLPDLATVERILARAAGLATDFLYIHHPSFEDEHYLASLGLRLYYHHWSGHKSHVLCSDLFGMFERLSLLRYHVRPLRPILDSAHPAVLPTSTPKNQHEYDAARHGRKPEVIFAHTVYQHIEFFVALKSIPDDEWRGIVGA